MQTRASILSFTLPGGVWLSRIRKRSGKSILLIGRKVRTNKVVYGRVGGIAVCVAALWDELEEMYCCCHCSKRFTCESDLIGHTQDAHMELVKGGYPLRDAG